MAWEVHVTGPTSVLTELAHAFQGKDPSIIRRGDHFLLCSRTFESIPSAEAIRIEAERIVEALSGLSRVLLQSDSPLKLASVVDVRSNGTQHIFVQPEPDMLRVTDGLVSLVVSHGDGRVEEHRPSDPVPVLLARALADPVAARALRLRDVPHMAWTDLYRLYEVVEAAAGGEDALVKSGWVTRSNLRRFRHSANSVTAAGDQARHGVEPTQPPADAMTLSEARSVIDAILTRWLGQLPA
jgi:hypothetical protein